jgi:predicted transcriptional regulator
MLTHDQLTQKMLTDPAVSEAFAAMEPEFALLDELLRARKAAGLSQAQVAALMGTKAPAVARLESALADGRHSPSVATLRKYAKAVGKKLIIQLR